MKTYIKTSDEKEGKIDFFWENGKHIGYAQKLEDGFYYFMANSKGMWNDYGLKEISNKLFQLNKSWDEQLKKVTWFKKENDDKTN